MYYFEITKNKKEEFVLGLRAKNAELLFKTEGYATKAHAKKMAAKIIGLVEETEIRDLTIVPKVDKAAAKAPVAKKPAAKKTQKNTESAK